MITTLLLSSVLAAATPTPPPAPVEFLDPCLVGLVDPATSSSATAAGKGEPCDELVAYNFTDCDLYCWLLLDCDGDGEVDELDEVWLDSLDDGPGIEIINIKWYFPCEILDLVWIESHPADCEPKTYWVDDCTVVFY